MVETWRAASLRTAKPDFAPRRPHIAARERRYAHLRADISRPARAHVSPYRGVADCRIFRIFMVYFLIGDNK